MYLLTDMANHVINQHQDFTELGKDIFTDWAPENPDELLVFYEYSGTPTALGMSNFTNRSVQVVTRATTGARARELSWQIFKMFNDTETRTIMLGDRMTQMYPRQTPYRMRRDDKDRVYYVFNLGVSTNFDY